MAPIGLRAESMNRTPMCTCRGDATARDHPETNTMSPGWQAIGAEAVLGLSRVEDMSPAATEVCSSECVPECAWTTELALVEFAHDPQLPTVPPSNPALSPVSALSANWNWSPTFTTRAPNTASSRATLLADPELDWLISAHPAARSAGVPNPVRT